MPMKIIITNNPMVRDKLHGQTVEFYDTDYLDILKVVRDKIHLGHGLLTHPLSGSVKPGETPYKTVIITGKKSALDENALSIIEESILTCVKLTAKAGKKNLTDKILADFQLIDYSLIFG
jgi:hypothetical protein